MRDGNRFKLQINTPEGISFSLPLAGPFLRFLAIFIDTFCIAVLLTLVSMLLSSLKLFSVDLSNTLTILAAFVVWQGYGIVLEWFWHGQTVGKRLLKLRVMDERGLRLHFSQVFIRNLFRVLDIFPLFYAVGGIVCIFSGKVQRLGDLAAGTIVVRHLAAPEFDTTILESGKYNSFRDYPRLEARLRQRTPATSAEIAFQALARREELEPSARLQLFKELADYFRALSPFPEEATFGLTDEQYTRNVVETLFRERAASKKS